MDNVLEFDRRLRVDTSPLVEVSHRGASDGRFEWIGLLNHTGQGETATHEPVPIADVKIRLRPLRPVRSVRFLKGREEIPFSILRHGVAEVVVPRVEG